MYGRALDEFKQALEALNNQLSFTKNNISELEKEKKGLMDQLDSNPMAFMDEDEKEMIQEARARLANVRGKKASRKER